LPSGPQGESRSGEGAGGTEVLRIHRREDVSQLDGWVHDAYLEDELKFSAESARAVIPFAQESGWGARHANMPDPELVKTTLVARHFHVPLTRCFIVVEHATAFEADIDWGNPSLVEAELSGSTLHLKPGSFAKGIRVAVSDIDIRVLVSSAPAGRLYRKVLRGWPIESDRWVAEKS
jgi:hypothetical protein